MVWLSGLGLNGRSARHEGHARSIHTRRGIETIFGWIQQWDGLRQFKLRGQDNVSGGFGPHVIGYNLIRMGNILQVKPSS